MKTKSWKKDKRIISLGLNLDEKFIKNGSTWHTIIVLIIFRLWKT